MMKRMMVFAAAVGLALAVHGAVVTAADGDTVVIGTDVSNTSGSTELVVTTGASVVTLVLPPAVPRRCRSTTCRSTEERNPRQ